jgi:hypothetical protein
MWALQPRIDAGWAGVPPQPWLRRAAVAAVVSVSTAPVSIIRTSIPSTPLDLPRFRREVRAWDQANRPEGMLSLLIRDILQFGPRQSHSSVPARMMVRPSRTAAVKHGPGPPGGAARSSDDDAAAAAEREIARSRPSGSRMTISAGPRPDRRSLTGKHLPYRDDADQRS